MTGNTRTTDVIQLRIRRTHNPHGHYFAEVIRARHTTFGGEFSADLDREMRALDTVFEGMTYYWLVAKGYDTPACREREDLHRDMAEIGARLWDLLPPAITRNLPRLLQSAALDKRPLRLVVEVEAEDRAARLLGLPWELLYLPETRRFPAQGPQLEIVRRVLGVPQQTHAELRTGFSVLHMVATPAHHAIDPDAVRAERASLIEILGDARYQAVPTPGSVAQLLDAIDTRAHDAFHFLGHGQLCTTGDADDIGRGLLLFSDDRQEVQYVTAEHLQGFFAARAGAHLIVLPACRSASNQVHGIAVSLILAGFPYVVAMQGDLPQRAIVPFTRALYTALDASSDVPRAVAMARHAISREVPDTPDWALPVLYTNAGLTPPRIDQRLADRVGHRFSEVGGAMHDLVRWHALLALAHLYLATLLWLSDLRHPEPDWLGLHHGLGWLGLCAPLIAALVVRQNRAALHKTQGRGADMIQFFRLWSFTAITQGMLVTEVLLVVPLLSGAGLWGALSEHARLALLAPVWLLGLLLPYAVARANLLGFLGSDRLRKPRHDALVFVVIAAGYLMLFAPYLAARHGLGWFGADAANESPALNLSLGLLSGLLAALVHLGLTHRNPATPRS